MRWRPARGSRRCPCRADAPAPAAAAGRSAARRKSFQIRAALGPAMHRQPGRLVDHQHQPVAMEHARLDFFGRRTSSGKTFVSHEAVECDGLSYSKRMKRLTHLPRSSMNLQIPLPRERTKLSWWRRLSSGLKRTSSSLGTAVADLVTKRKLDRAMLEDIEDVLLRADLGTEVAARIAAAVGVGRYDKAITADEVKNVVATEVEKVLAPVAKPLAIDRARRRSSSWWSASTAPARPPPSASSRRGSAPKAAR